MRDEYLKFWDRVVTLLNDRTIKEMCIQTDISYKTTRNNRSCCRLPNLEDAYKIASYLNTSVEYLLTGRSDSTLSKTMMYIRDHKEAEIIIKSLMKDESLLPLYEAIAYREIQKASIEPKREKEA